ncbi:MAG: hypothetical protein JWQ02_1979 [Capsulimonas sp.]|nr:hypothetical protein [Capsulimonas sp.]
MRTRNIIALCLMVLGSSQVLMGCGSKESDSKTAEEKKAFEGGLAPPGVAEKMMAQHNMNPVAPAQPQPQANK